MAHKHTGEELGMIMNYLKYRDRVMYPLSNIEDILLCMRVGYGMKQHTYQEIADILNLSTKERSRQKIEKALRKLRHPHRREQIVDLSNGIDQLSIIVDEYRYGNTYEEAWEDVNSDCENIILKPVSILELGYLKARVLFCLQYEDIYYIRDLIDKTEIELKEIPNLGHKSFKSIKSALNKVGLKLKKE